MNLTDMHIESNIHKHKNTDNIFILTIKQFGFSMMTGTKNESNSTETKITFTNRYTTNISGYNINIRAILNCF